MNKIQKFLSVVFFIAIFVVLIYLIQNYGIEPLRNKIESMGIWAPFGIFDEDIKFLMKRVSQTTHRNLEYIG